MSIRSNALGHYGDLSPELHQILRRNGMQAHLIIQNGEPHLAVQGHDSPLLTYRITPQQLKALTDGGTNSANRKAYNTFAALVERDFHLPKDFVHARNANGRVVMGLHGYRIGAGEYGRPEWRYGGPRVYGGYGPHAGFGGHHAHLPFGLWMQRGILGWTPRQQDGFHMRRVGGALFMQGAPMVADRPDHRIKPGELQNGGYGFYYKGYQSAAHREAIDVPQGVQQDGQHGGQYYGSSQGVANQSGRGNSAGMVAASVASSAEIAAQLENIVPVIQTRPRPIEEPKAYSEVITSDVYFSQEKWQSVLESHGIVVDAESKTLTIQSAAINKDFVYDLRDEEIEKLLDNSLERTPLEQRLELLNGITSLDYNTPITKEMLEAKELINLAVKPEVIEEISKAERQAVEQSAQQGTAVQQGTREQAGISQSESQGLNAQQTSSIQVDGQQRTDGLLIEPINLSERQIPQEFLDEQQGIARVHGADLYQMADEAWFREGEHGREVSVEEIRVEPIQHEPNLQETESNGRKHQKNEMTYRMTAVINGESISHEITQRQYDKFMAVDDYHRMKLFSKIFNEVDMKQLPKERDGRSFGLGLLAALTVAGEVAHGIIHHGPRPEFYMERHGGGPVYMKPGVDSPQDIARRAFDAGINAAEHGVGLSR